MGSAEPGKWSWESGANVTDSCLTGYTGSFTAITWSNTEKQENQNRRGFIRTSPNGLTFKDMHDDEGIMPFMFPGKCAGITDACANYDSLNPAYRTTT